ncbi:hypothetical protein M3Y97_00771700 [Aphelenchoides bicaudatus]|nr:hypothetical protein M3Y97_00771700 [Aphelenchoides bicaudatus]
MRFTVLAFSIAFWHLSSATIHKTSYYSSDRQLRCVNYGGENTRCALHEEGRNTETNPGCFDELDEKNQTRVYCRLNCEESDEATVLSKVPTNNHACNNYFNYHIERRRRDWYLWRSGACISTTITFEVRCGFPSDPRQFYSQNKHLFEYEDSPTNKVQLSPEVKRLLEART